MPAPLIGITTYERDANGQVALPVEYVDAVRRAGGVPLLLPPGESNLGHLLKVLDGLILSGGGDVGPEHYGGYEHEAIYLVDPERDRSEIGLVNAVIKSGLPTLGICRGMQVINVALGGTLVEHVPDEFGAAIQHRLPPDEATRHAIYIESGTRLASIVEQDQIEAASWHHQAIRKPAPGLQVVATAPDGTIEAVEHGAHPWLLALQWHPELTAAGDPLQQRIFTTFVDAARQRTQRLALGAG